MATAFLRAKAACALFLALASPSVHALAAYPERPVRIVVGFTPGSGGDTITRLVGAKLSEKWKQPVVVENRIGASNTIAVGIAARATPDGYTLVMVNANYTVTPNQMKLDYDPIRSFSPISLLVTQPDVLVASPSVPARSLKEFIAYVKANPGRLNFGSSGIGGSPYMAMALLMHRTGMNMVSINYKGSNQALLGLLGGEVQVMFGSVTSVLHQSDIGRLKVLAVSTKDRFAGLPDVPTVAEAAGLAGYDVSAWQGVLAPAGTSGAIVNRLYKDMVVVLHLPDVQAALERRGNVMIANTPREFADFIRGDIPRWGALLKAMKIRQ